MSMLCAVEAAAKGTHYIEEAVRVYLMRDLDGAAKWVVDPATVDGHPLESDYDGGPVSAECLCDRPAECRAAVESMDEVDMPTATELLVLLAESLGYTIAKED